MPLEQSPPEKFDAYSRKGPYKVGDVVHADGSCAILGDVKEVEQEDEWQLVTVVWRGTETTEQDDDLWLVETDAP